MDASAVRTETGGTRQAFAGTLGALALGFVVGALAYYAIAVVANAPVPGDYTIKPLSLVMIAIVGVLAVAVGWRWPVVGLAAGTVIIALVVFAVTGRTAWSAGSWLDPFNAVGFGAASGYPTLVGATMLTASALGLRSRRTGRRKPGGQR